MKPTIFVQSLNGIPKNFECIYGTKRHHRWSIWFLGIQLDQTKIWWKDINPAETLKII